MSISETIHNNPFNPALPAPPRVPGIPLLGNAIDFLNRPMQFFLDCYHTHGPIFRIKVAHQKFVVMAGLEANRFMAQDRDEIFSSERLFGEFARQMGSVNFLVALDGAPHRHMRRVMQRGYSKSGIAPHLDDFARLAYQTARTWMPGQTLFARDTFQRLVTEQLGTALTSHSSREHFEAIRIYMSTSLNVLVTKSQPRFMLATPRYVNACRQVMEFAQQVLEEHRHSSDHHAPDLVDDLLAAVDWNGDPLTEDDLLATTIGPFFAGMDTVANTMGFMVYAILKHPKVYEAIQAEVDEFFADGIPPYQELPKSDPTLRLFRASRESRAGYPLH